jgi:hypothetical protein
MSRLFASVLLFSSFSVAAEPLTLSAADWTAPRTGAALVQQPALVKLLRALEQEPDGVAVISHATSETGQLWAEELRGWLVALGVSSAQIRFDARTELTETLTLAVRQREQL